MNTAGISGPNFGMVEATIALHYVFNSPEDKIVFDVSHQSYVHKMLTDGKMLSSIRQSMTMYRVIPNHTKANMISLLSVILPLPSAWLAD